MRRSALEAIPAPRNLLEELRRLAAKRGKPLEILAAELLAQPLDPKTRIKTYLNLYRKYLREAEELYRKGDHIQAGEKLWGAIAALLNTIGELEDKPHYQHSDYWEIIEDLVRETGDPEYSTLFTLAEKLHANYHDSSLLKSVKNAGIVAFDGIIRSKV